VFQNYLSYSALAKADDEAVTGGFNNRSRDDMTVIHTENSLDLGEERPSPEISFVPNMAGSSDTWPSQHFELLRTFRSALACKEIMTNNSETLRQLMVLPHIW
jgi:hypothetical protein